MTASKMKQLLAQEKQKTADCLQLNLAELRRRIDANLKRLWRLPE